METSIIASCAIRGHQIFLNGTLRYEAPAAASLTEFLVGAYRHFGLSYPKFFKMDVLCKLAFLTAELLLPATGILDRLDAGGIGVVLANRSSSLLTDLAHQQSIQEADNHFPSPAVFVYTLPNIAIGEISIRHQLSGENTLFVADAYSPDTLQAYVAQLLAEGSCQACLCGWLEAGLTSHETFFYVVESHEPSSTTRRPHHVPALETLYAQPLY
ncbi:beta-ketoacyl synthase N-terminal-like domain-containing protein [Hymenobacter cavernae]|uniref:Beta-ketoacyl synthase-like N-terminal domain-containing protein n=1 Tax=Hymenobacter cavernae TaxID=2044852 RepID=A0ABQ1TVD2_9BACT|nr:beta-ketoacyl synthase N-terminal-like domain-containing protein [Hymenobacter cavernae]GGF03900.1 hypothetical protein GCM10011383_13710 [Hymenobacter cavernae]